MQAQAQFGAFADAYRLVADAFDALLPVPEQKVWEWAAAKRMLDNPGGGYTGYWNNEYAPFWVKPMDALKGSTYMTVALVGPGQCGKTTVAENWVGASVDIDPADFLWYMQTEPAIEDYVKDRINPYIESHPCLHSKLGLKAVDSSLHYKRFTGMSVKFLAAVYANLISKTAPRIIADEIDAYSPSLGDIMSLLNIRRTTFGRSGKILVMSHPDRATGLKPDEDWKSGIMSVYRDSDRRVWYWPCPECGLVSSPAPTARYVTELNYPTDKGKSLDQVAAETVLICPHNGCIIENHQRRDMNIAAYTSDWGGWIGEGQEISPEGKIDGQLIETDTAGFWMMGAMSPFLANGIGGLARAIVKAERELESGETDEAAQSLRTAWTKGIGSPPPERKKPGSIDATVLAERADPTLKLGQVPDWVRFITVFVDIQGLYFDVMARGWGKGGESIVIDQFKIVLSERTNRDGEPLPVDPAHEPADWDMMLGRLMTRRYPLTSDPTRGMAIRGIGFDSQGAPGVTTQAYAAWKRWRIASPDRPAQIRMLGKDRGGRDVFSVIPMRGLPGAGAQKLLVVYPDSQRTDRKAAAKGEVPLAQFRTDSFKTEMAGHLGKAEVGGWYVHFPAELLSVDDKGKPKPPHLFFEQLVAEVPNKAGHWDKVKPNSKNEALDQLVGTHVIAHLHGVHRINWDRPPPWAAAHDVNALVGPIETPSGEGTAVGVAPIQPPSQPQAVKKSWLDRMAH